MSFSRKAIDAKLRNWATKHEVDALIARRRFSFERALARLVAAEETAWVIKGGRGLDYRFHGKARPTRDVDLVLHGLEADSEQVLRGALNKAFAVDVNDGFEFSILSIRGGSRDVDGSKLPWPSFDVKVQAAYDGQPFEMIPFDIQVRDRSRMPISMVETEGMLGFNKVQILSISPEEQLAEKVHAITRQYASGRASTRVWDLVDCVAIIRECELDPDKLAEAAKIVFEERNTHGLPRTLPQPQEEWREGFGKYGKGYGLEDLTLEEGWGELKKFWDRALEKEREGVSQRKRVGMAL